MSGSEMERIRKNLIKIFQECDVSIVRKISLTSDVRFNMKQLNNATLYTQTNIQITYKIYLEVYQIP